MASVPDPKCLKALSPFVIVCVCVHICLGNRRVNFLLDTDGKPKLAIIAEDLPKNVAQDVKTPVPSLGVTKRLIRLYGS